MARRFELPSSGGRRDPEHKIKFLGLVVPGMLVLWAVINLITCQAAWPVLRGRHLSIAWVTDFFRVTMAAAVKLGIAVACFGWYYMANRDDWAYWTQLVTLAGCVTAVAAFVFGSLAFVF